MKTLSVKVTSRWLTAQGACKKQKDVFKEEWPRGSAITKGSLTRAAELGLDLEWFANQVIPHLLDVDYQAKRNTLDVDYDAECKPLEEEFEAKLAPVDEEFEAKLVLLKTDYKAKFAGVYTDYKADVAPLIAEYNAKHALLVAKHRASINVLVLAILLEQCTD